MAKLNSIEKRVGTLDGKKRPGRKKGSVTKNRSKRTRVFKCLRCGIEVIVRVKAGTPQKFCSNECQVLHRKETRAAFIEKTCEVCGVKYSTQNHNQKYCSLDCHGVNTAQRHKSNRPMFHCKKCGKPFFRNQKPSESRLYCSRKCAGVGEMGKGISSRFGAGGTHRQRAKRFGVDYESIRIEDVFKRDGWHCQICGKPTPKNRRGTKYSNAPELDHRIPMSKGGGHVYENVQCTCHACNLWKSNNNEFGQLPLFQIKQ